MNVFDLLSVLILCSFITCSRSTTSENQGLAMKADQGAGGPIRSAKDVQPINRRALNCYALPFANAQPPTGFRSSMSGIKHICVPKPDQTYFAVMFDEERGIAEYCGYVLNEQDAARLVNSDPDDLSPPPIMGPFSLNTDIIKQGSDGLYSPASGMERGFLVPPYTLSYETKHFTSTKTYANIVPVYPALLKSGWGEYQRKIREFAKRVCCKKGSGGVLYLLSGTSDIRLYGVTSGFPKGSLPEYFPDMSNPNKIVKPQMLWTAGCCIKQELTHSFAVTGNNVNGGKGDTSVSMQTVKVLQDVLTLGVKPKGGQNVQLFPGRPECSDPENNMAFSFNIM